MTLAKAIFEQAEAVVRKHVADREFVPLTDGGAPQDSWLAAVRFEVRTKCEPIAHAYGENMFSIRVALEVLFYVFTITVGHRTFRLTGEEVR